MILYPDTRLSFSPTSATVQGDDGVPRRKFRKDLIKTGTYVKDSEGIEFQITSDTLRHWVQQFSQMKANGVKVPIPSGHKNAGDADKNRGYVEDIFIVGDMLVMSCEMIGKEGIEAAAKSDVSIYSPEDLKDGHGTVYERPIEHVALCTDPVVPGLGEFIPLAASQSAKGKAMDLKKIKEVFNIEEDLTPENVEALVLSKHADTVKTLEELGAKLKVLEVSLEKKDGPKPDPQLVSLSSDNRKMKLEGLVAAGRITPAVLAKLSKLYVDHIPVALSLSNGTANQFDLVFEALKENDPVVLKEMTGKQVTLSALDNPVEGDKPNMLVADAERRAKEAKG